MTWFDCLMWESCRLTSENCKFRVDAIFRSQKLFDNAFVRDPEVRETFRWAKSLWNAFLVQGLGMIPIIESNVHELSHKSGALELLRVRSCLFNEKKCCSKHCNSSHMTSLQVRNRFAEENPQGGYRDINIKIRVGFKGDPRDSRPVFVPVYVQFNSPPP